MSNEAIPSRPQWFPTALFPFESRFAEVAGCRVHYVDEGSGPTLLLLHGNPSWSFLYRDIIRLLKAEFRCIAFDHPGFGLSTAPDGYAFTPEAHSAVAEALVEQLDLRDVTMMVQDWGGPIGLGVAVRHPARFQALVIGNTWAWPVNGDPHFERFSRLMGGALGGFLIRRFNLFVNALIPAGVKRHRVPAAVMRAYRAPLSTPARREPTHIFPRQILEARNYLQTLSDGLSRLAQLPALILWGDRDIAFRAKERERFERLFPHHVTRMLSGAGHFIQEDAPDEIAEAIRSWAKDRHAIRANSKETGF